SAVDGRVDEAGGDAVDPDADDREVAGDGQGHADDATLRGRVGDLADLAVEGRHRGDGDDAAAGTVGVDGLGLGHRGGRQAHAVEGADEVDPDDPLEEAEVVGRLVLPVAPDRAGGHA